MNTNNTMATARSPGLTKLASVAMPANLPDGGETLPTLYPAASTDHTILSDVHALTTSFSEGQGMRLLPVLLSAAVAVLHRVVDVSSFIVGIPVVGPRHVRANGSDGPLLLLSVGLQPNSSFLELCHQTNTAIVSARTGESETRNAEQSVHSSARVTAAWLAFSSVRQDAAGKALLDDPSLLASPDLILTVIELQDRLRIKLQGLGDRYSPEWLHWRVLELEAVLRHGCTTPGISIGQLALLPDTEREFLVQGLNNSAVPYRQKAAIVELIEEQVTRTPMRSAVRQGDSSVTYQALDDSANRLAHALRRRGVGRGSLVGLCVNRSPDMVGAVLAVLKAGGTYVPLDPSFPAERLSYMLEDSKVSLVISESSLRSCHGYPPERTLELDTASAEISRETSARIPHDEQSAGPEDVGYILYTSGSTGRPKGVCVGQRGIVNFITSMQHEPGLTMDDRLLAVTTLSFDIAALELFLPLSVGAEIVLATREESMDGFSLRRLLEHHHITVMQATPVTWRFLLGSGWEGDPGLTSLCGGEAMPLDLAESLLERVGRLWNMYGPTETTVWSTCWRVDEPRAGIHVGRPIANTSVWILDDQLQLCPVGAVGEIYIGGDGVALGYLHRPDLTKERFLPNPFDPTPGARMYKTGDLGRWRTDGHLECLGRNDFQVKIHGYRIELGEIEAALLTHPEIAQAIVHVKPSQVDDDRLVAYVVRRDRGLTIPPGMLSSLRKTLPTFMVPSAIVPLLSFPLTPNGKIDRAALPAPDKNVRGPEGPKPSTPTENRLVEIWRGLLKIDSIATDISFFDLGGHSLLAMTLASAVRRELGVDYPVAQLLQGPTVADMARIIDASSAVRNGPATQGSTSAVLLRAGGPKRIFLSYSGTGELSQYLRLALRLPPEFAVYGITPARLGSLPQVDLTIPSMAQHLVKVIREVQPEGPYYLGGLCAGGVIAFEAAHQIEANGGTISRLVLLDAANPQAPLRRWLTAKLRWERFKRVFTGDIAEQTAQPEVIRSALESLAMGRTWIEAWLKVRNTAMYEVTARVESLSVLARLKLLEYLLDHDRQWPEWVPVLSERDIYMRVKGTYHPDRVKAEVLLVRASGDGKGLDVPEGWFVDDAALGWADHVSGPFHIVDVAGAHVGMLTDEDCVDELTEKLNPLLTSNDNPLRLTAAS